MTTDPGDIKAIVVSVPGIGGTGPVGPPGPTGPPGDIASGYLFAQRQLVNASSTVQRADLFDTFHRTNGTLVGSTSESGHVWTSSPASGAEAEIQIVNNRLRITPPTGQARIGYIQMPNSLKTVSAEFVFLGAGATTNGANAVIGACRKGFGVGSIQLAIYEGRTTTALGAVLGGGTANVDWTLFATEQPITDPYPIIAWGTFATPIDRTGATVYQASMSRVSNDTVALLLPDGEIKLITHALIAQYWGSKIGIQVRRPNTTDGNADFLSVASAQDVAIGGAASKLDSGLYFSGGTSNYASVTVPPDWTMTSFYAMALLKPDTWKPSAAYCIASQFATSPNIGWRFMISGSGALQLRCSMAGTSEDIVADSTVSIGGVDENITGVKVTRSSSNGDIKFYTTSDDGANWTQLGTTVSSTSGAFHQSSADIVVGKGNTSSYNGLIRYMEVGNSEGNVVASFDARKLWLGSTYIGSGGGEWKITGTLKWKIDRTSDVIREWQAKVGNYVGWSFDPACIDSTGTQLTSGTLTGCRVMLEEDATVAGIAVYVTNGGSSLTSSQNFAAIYDASGNRLAVTADQSTAWASAGDKVMALTAPVTLKAGIYRVAFLCNSTGNAVTLARGAASTAINVNGSGQTGWRFFTADTGATATPSVMGTTARYNVSLWAALTI